MRIDYDAPQPATTPASSLQTGMAFATPTTIKGTLDIFLEWDASQSKMHVLRFSDGVSFPHKAVLRIQPDEHVILMRVDRLMYSPLP